MHSLEAVTRGLSVCHALQDVGLFSTRAQGLPSLSCVFSASLYQRNGHSLSGSLNLSAFRSTAACFCDQGMHAQALTDSGVRAQALAIEQGTGDLISRALLQRHLTFHYMVDADAIAVLTCVAEWEAGFVEDVLPCFKYSAPPQPLPARRRRLRAADGRV